MPELLERVTDISFHQAGRSITPSKVFHEYYDGLQPLLRHNRKHSDNLPDQTTAGKITNKAQKEEKKLFREWRDSLPEDISATVRYRGDSDNSEPARTNTMDLNVQPRLNLETTFSGESEKRARRKTMPNVLFLEEKDGSEVYVLRKAETYKPSSYTYQSFSKMRGDKLDHFAYNDFTAPDTEGYQHGKKGGFLFIPEPYLVAGLERAFDEIGVARTIPKSLHVHTDEKSRNTYFLRNYLDSVRSRPTEKEKFVGYLASMHSLGLTDRFDRQAEHYCLARGGHWKNWEDIINIGKSGVKPSGAPVVNIDPDYITHVGNVKQELHHDKADFFNELIGFQQNIFEEDKKWFNESYRSLRMSDEYQAVFRNDLLPRSIDDVKSSFGYELLTKNDPGGI